MKPRFTSTVAGASIFIAVFSLFGRGLGFFREIIFAGYFGTGEDFDVYLVGAVLPLTIGTTLNYIGQNYFIPSYNNYLSIDGNKPKEFVSKIFLVFVFSGIAIGIFLYIIANPIINLYLENSSILTRKNAYYIYIVFLLTLPFSAGIAILSAYLESEFEFKYPSISRLLLNISTILFVLILGKQIGVFIIAIGYLVGSILQLIYLIIKVKPKIFPRQIYFLRNKTEIKSIFSFSMVAIILIELISQLYSLFDRYFYNEVSSGGIAALNYAQTLFLFPISILAMSLGTVIFPKISNAVKENSNEKIKSLFHEAVLVILIIFTPISFVFIFYSNEVVRLILERGNFDITSTIYTAAALKYFSYSLIFYGVYSVINKIFYSIGLIKTLLVITIIGIILKFVLNYVFVGNMQHNGLALATTISYLFFFVTCFVILNYRLKLIFIAKFLNDLFIMVTDAGLSIILVRFFFGSLFMYDYVNSLLQVIIFFLIFILNLMFINHSSIKIFFNVFMRLKGNFEQIKPK